MRRHLLIICSLLLLATSLTSCRDARSSLGRGCQEALFRAEALMEDSPRVARAILDSLKIVNRTPSFARLNTSKNKQGVKKSSNRKSLALYALLRTQADYKSGEKLTSDSLIRIAVDYYGTRRKTQHAALAQYYLGCTYGDMGRDLDAIDAHLRATTLFPDTTNKYYAYSQRDLGELLLNCEQQQNALEALKHYRQADVCRSDSVNLGWADWYMGLAYLYLEQSGKAESFLSATLANPSVRELHDNARFQLAKLYAFLDGDYDKARTCIDGYIAGYDKKEKIGAAFFVKGEVCYHAGELDSAFYYYNKVLACEKDIRTHCETYKRLIELSQPLGRADSVTVWFQRYVALSDSVHQIRKDKEISDIESNHVVELHDRELAAHRSRLQWTWGILFVFSAFLVSIALLFLDRKRKNERLKYEAELMAIKQRYIAQTVRKEETAAEGEQSILSDGHTPSINPIALQEERKKLYKRQYEASDWTRYFEKHQPDIKAKRYMPSDDAKRFERYLNGLFIDVLVDMIKENPCLTNEDTLHCVMTLLGFKPSQIAYCSRSTPSSCYTRRNRIKSKLSAEWCLFIFGKASE